MQKMKNQSGVTLTSLAITIIVLMIILGVGINQGIDAIYASRDKKIQSELQIVQKACMTEYVKAKQLGFTTNGSVKPANFAGTEITIADLPVVEGAWLFSTEPTEKYKKYYRLTPEDLAALSISETEYTYIVNYYSGEVYNETKERTSDGKPLYAKGTVIQPVQNVDTTNYVNW